MAELPDGSVDLILTSPPFLKLRDYLPGDHPDKAREIGTEPTPAAFVDTLLRLTAEWGRLLAPHGSLVVELGDTYSGDARGEGSASWADEDHPGRAPAPTPKRMLHRSRNAGSVPGHATGGDGWPLDKSLCGIPHLYYLALSYGMNLLTGEPSPAGLWRVRNLVAWCRPNPPVGLLSDKYRPATSYLTVATRGPRRYFDLDAVRTPPTTRPQRRFSAKWGSSPDGGVKIRDYGENYLSDEPTHFGNEAGVPPLDWWSVPGDAGPMSDPDSAVQYLLGVIDELTNADDGTPPDWWEIPAQPYKGAHYATWPAALLERPIESMCPRKVCTACGQPSTRIVERESTGQNTRRAGTENDPRQAGAVSSTEVPDYSERRTLGWTDCGHDSWRNGLVLDPFAGSGTTLAVATGRSRDAIGIDLDDRNVELVQQRVGMFLTDVEMPCSG